MDTNKYAFTHQSVQNFTLNFDTRAEINTFLVFDWYFSTEQLY